ncbi:MAG: NAD(P)H-dependent flavin oxidoreductase [Alphaproteobacteria bacterium]
MAYLNKVLDIKHPIIMAPMFLVSNVDMIISAYKSGIIGCLPAHNFRTQNDLEKALQTLTTQKIKFGINLIVNKSNTNYDWQIETVLKYGCDFIITSLGNPKQTIEMAHRQNVLVFCDVTNIEYAQKCETLGADALIGVSSDAGGHLGNIPSKELTKILKANVNIPVLSAGGIGDYKSYQDHLNNGSDGVSIGTVFIASKESGVNEKYKQAMIDYTDKDIVITSKLSGTPCTVINTPAVQKIGTEENWLEKILNKNKWLKRMLKTIRFLRSWNTLEKAAFSASYDAIWCAGRSIKFVDKILPVAKIVEKITRP